MADKPPSWRDDVTAIERYDKIQEIKTILEATNPVDAPSHHQEAFKIEKAAYDNSGTREEYDSACLLQTTISDPNPISAPDATDDSSRPQSPGITIGDYHSCHHVSGGVTSEVYRSGVVALKVIAETHILEPHNPQREAKILSSLTKPIIPLLSTFRDQEQRLVLTFPYMPLTLETLLATHGPLTLSRLSSHFHDLLSALHQLHTQGIIHRDIKPSALLLASPDGPAYLSDFGTAWHPSLSISSEPSGSKILDIGTGAYRAPEVLFGNKSYTSAIDIWGAGVMLTECSRSGPAAKPIFESRATHEDGNQLSLILSIFKTIGSPTEESWPEAKGFRTPPFEMYQTFEGRGWDELLDGVDNEVKGLVKWMLRYESGTRPSAEQVLASPMFASRKDDHRAEE